MAADPHHFFRIEATQLVDELAAALADLAGGDGGAQVPRLLRLAHTLKGAARIVREAEIADRAHAIEDVLGPYREATAGVPPGCTDAVQQHLEAIAARVAALGSAAARQPEPAAASPAGRSHPVRLVHAEWAEMDALQDGIAEAHALIGGLRAALPQIGEARRLAGLLAEQFSGPGYDLRRARAAGDGAAALRDRLAMLERRVVATTERLDRELRQLRAAAEQLRLAGVDALFAILERTARDTADALAKEVVFSATGAGLRLEADVLADAQNALIQLVRNAVAHGIEAPGERRAAGKPAAGQIAVEARRCGDRVVFSCRDDGRGFDFATVRRIAAQRGLVPADHRIGTDELIGLLLRGGITTSRKVTEVAGRGIGLDVVREATERLAGTVAVRTAAGEGTVVELDIPVMWAAIEALLAQAGGSIVAIPLEAVERAVLLTGTALAHDAAGATLVDGSEAMPFLWLPGILGGETNPAAERWPSVIIDAAAGRAAIGVERILGTARTVMRPLAGLAPGAGLAAGAALDPEGSPQLVLDPDGLLAAARQAIAMPEPEPARRKVLVVDDSPTTRMLEQSILETAGYAVDTASTAEEALETARRERYALFLVDVEMPGMDGFRFIERVDSDPVLRGTPAILVTSRARPEDCRRGREVGAQGYIVKGEFDQRELLSTIEAVLA